MPAHPPVYQALCEALDDEYKARAAYAAVIDRYGPVRPFVNIIQSEQRHIHALQMLFRQRGWAIPDDPYGGKMTAPETLEQACEMGVQAELDNVALYDRLRQLATDDLEVLAVFRNLQQASQERHLPAFQRGPHHDAGTCCGGRGDGPHGHSRGGGGCG